MHQRIGDTLHLLPDLGTEWQRVGGTGYFIIWHVLISTFGRDVSGTFTVQPSPSPPCESSILQRGVGGGWGAHAGSPPCTLSWRFSGCMVVLHELELGQIRRKETAAFAFTHEEPEDRLLSLDHSASMKQGGTDEEALDMLRCLFFVFFSSSLQPSSVSC